MNRVLRIAARAGAPAIWLSPLGHVEQAEQHELLFTPGVRIRILGVDTSGEIPVIEVEVTK